MFVSVYFLVNSFYEKIDRGRIVNVDDNVSVVDKRQSQSYNSSESDLSRFYKCDDRLCIRLDEYNHVKYL